MTNLEWIVNFINLVKVLYVIVSGCHIIHKKCVKLISKAFYKIFVVNTVFEYYLVIYF